MKPLAASNTITRPFLRRDLLDRGPDLGHDLAGGLLVLRHGTALGSPDFLQEALVVADRPLQRLLLLLTLERGEDRPLVADLRAQLVDLCLLFSGLGAPALDLAVELRLSLLRDAVLLEDASGVNIADPDIRGAERPGPGRGGRRAASRPCVSRFVGACGPAV
jgi:hypothetical protein